MVEKADGLEICWHGLRITTVVLSPVPKVAVWWPTPVDLSHRFRNSLKTLVRREGIEPSTY